METYLITGHEEFHQQGEEEKNFGVLVNLSKEKPNWRESTIYVYKNGLYIFFETIYDMVNYFFVGHKENIKRAYMNEDTFDSFFDAEYIDGTFMEKLEWVNSENVDYPYVET